MSKAQFWTLNLVGGACALLLLANLVVGQFNNRIGNAVLARQTELSRAQQVQTTAQNLILRLAQGAQTNALLRGLMEKHEIKVNFSAPQPAIPAP
jgi:hypothetical protein